MTPVDALLAGGTARFDVSLAGGTARFDVLLAGGAARFDPKHLRALGACRAILERNSRSFAFAARFLDPGARDRAAAVYAYCRRVDDAIDGVSRDEQPRALRTLQEELDRCYTSALSELSDPVLRAFRVVILETGLPRRYPEELIDGMAMDVRDTRYTTREDLLLYCHRVAGVVGLMMCHVFGVTRDDALLPAAHLGIAMQLTNICRDVREDWTLGRLYLPRQLLAAHGAPAVPQQIAGPFPTEPRLLAAMQGVIGELLREADRYYASAERGIVTLPFTAGLAVRVASRLYRAIGVLVARAGCDPRRERAVVPGARKILLALGASVDHGKDLRPFARERILFGRRVRAPARALEFPEDVLAPP